MLVGFPAPWQQGGDYSDGTDGVEERLWQLLCFHPEQIGGVTADHTEGAERQREDEVWAGAEHQHQHVDPRLQQKHVSSVRTEANAMQTF